MEKIGLKIVDLIHDISQLEYEVKFCGDFSGMIRLELSNEFDESFYQHRHLGFPGCERERLEKDIINALAQFLKDIKEGNYERS